MLARDDIYKCCVCTLTQMDASHTRSCLGESSEPPPPHPTQHGTAWSPRCSLTKEPSGTLGSSHTRNTCSTLNKLIVEIKKKEAFDEYIGRFFKTCPPDAVTSIDCSVLRRGSLAVCSIRQCVVLVPRRRLSATTHQLRYRNALSSPAISTHPDAVSGRLRTPKRVSDVPGSGGMASVQPVNCPVTVKESSRLVPLIFHPR